MIERVISGGQTGADLAGLDAARICGLLTGGWVPKGRRNEAGTLTDAQMKLYTLVEHASAAYAPRTEENIRWADATLLFGSTDSPGSTLAIRLARMHNKPLLAVGLPTLSEVPHSLAWLRAHRVKVLNVAGNRESRNPGIYTLTVSFLINVFRGLR